jgi:hypothetical protein
MKLFNGFLVFLSLAPSVGFATNVQCDLFESAISTSVGSQIPHLLESGKTYTFTSSLKIINEVALNKINPASRIGIWHLFRNGVPGSSGSSSDPSYDLTDLFLKKNGDSLIGQNSLLLGVNFTGKYSLAAFFTIQTPEGDYCGGELPSDVLAEFEVRNVTGKADILPPVFSSSRILSKQARPGSTFVVETKVKDDSPICGLAEKLSSICSGVWHVALTSSEGHVVNSFEPNALLPDGTVVALVKVPKDTIPGRYRLSVHDISDIFENLFVDVPELDAPFIDILPAE